MYCNLYWFHTENFLLSGGVCSKWTGLNLRDACGVELGDHTGGGGGGGGPALAGGSSLTVTPGRQMAEDGEDL